MSEFIGPVILAWDGKEIECASLSTETQTGKRVVKTMNRSGNAAGHAQGIREHRLTVEVPIPTDGTEPDWGGIENAKLSIYDVDEVFREVYTGCEVETVSSKYVVDGAALRTLTVTALEHRKQ